MRRESIPREETRNMKAKTPRRQSKTSKAAPKKTSKAAPEKPSRPKPARGKAARARSSVPSRPDAAGHFGQFGGRYVPETLMPVLFELEKAYLEARDDPSFRKELGLLLRDYAGRPTPLFLAQRLSKAVCGGL